MAGASAVRSALGLEPKAAEPQGLALKVLSLEPVLPEAGRPLQGCEAGEEEVERERDREREREREGV